MPLQFTGPHQRRYEVELGDVENPDEARDFVEEVLKDFAEEEDGDFQYGEQGEDGQHITWKRGILIRKTSLLGGEVDMSGEPSYEFFSYDSGNTFPYVLAGPPARTNSDRARRFEEHLEEYRME